MESTPLQIKLRELHLLCCKSSSAHERQNIYDLLRELAGEQDPIAFLLVAWLGEHNSANTYRNLYDGWAPTNDLVQENELVQAMIQAEPGDEIPPKVQAFLERCASDWEPQLRAYIEGEKARVHKEMVEMGIIKS